MTTTTTPAPLLAKVNRSGAVWQSWTIGRGVTAYRMERIDSGRRTFASVEGIEVRPADGGGWDVVLYGDVVDHRRTKVDAQRSAEGLLDNPRDADGWLTPTTCTR